MCHRVILAVALAGFACSGMAAPGKKASDHTWHAPQLAPSGSSLQTSGVARTLGGSPHDLDPDPNFGYGTGQMVYGLGQPNAPRVEVLRVHAMSGGAGWYVLAKHQREDDGWDAVVLQVNPSGEPVDEFLVQTSLDYIADAVLDPDTGKFYFVGSGHPPALPGNDSDFGVICVDITIPPDGGTCAGFGTGGTAWIGFDLGGENHEAAARVVVRPNIGLIVGGIAVDQDYKIYVVVASLYRASGALYIPFGTNGRFVQAINTTSPATQSDVEAMVLSNDPDAQTRVYIAGAYMVNDSGANTDGYVLALKAMTGVLDTGFNGNGIQRVSLDSNGCTTDCHSDWLRALAVQADGKLALAGTVEDDDELEQPMLGRLKVDGSFDTGFHGTGLFSAGGNWPGPHEIVPYAIAERPGTGELVVAMGYSMVTPNGWPQRQLLGQWSPNGNILRASRSFEFGVLPPESPDAEPSGLLVDANSAMMVGSRRRYGNYDLTLVRTLVDQDFLFSDGFE